MAKTDADVLDDLKTTRDNILERIKEVTAEKKPSYALEGRSYSWTEYLRMLREQLQETLKLINLFEGPSDEIVVGTTWPLR